MNRSRRAETMPLREAPVEIGIVPEFGGFEPLTPQSSTSPSILSLVPAGVPTDPWGDWSVDPSVQAALDGKRAELSAAEGQVQARSDEIGAVDGSISSVSGQLESARGALGETEGEVTRLEGEVTRLEGELGSLRSRRDGLVADKDAASARASTLRGEIAVLEQQVEAGRSPVPSSLSTTSVGALPSPGPTPLPGPTPQPSSEKITLALEEAKKTVPPERIQSLNEDVTAFQDATNTSFGGADPKKTLESLSKLGSPAEVDAWMALYNERFCNDGSGRELLTKESLRKKLATTLAPDDFLEASTRLDGDPVKGAEVALRNASRDPMYQLEASRARLSQLGVLGVGRQIVSDALGGSILKGLGAAKQLLFDWTVPDEMMALKSVDAQKIVDTMEKLTPEQRQKLLEGNPKLREQIPTALKQSPAKKELWSAMADGEDRERPQAALDVRNELRGEQQRRLLLEKRATDPAATLTDDDRAAIDGRIDADPDKLEKLTDERAALESKARIVTAKLIDSAVFDGGGDKLGPLLQQLRTDPALAERVLARYGETRHLLRQGTTVGAPTDGLASLRQDVADRRSTDTTRSGTGLLGPEAPSTRGAVDLATLDALPIEQQKARLLEKLPKGATIADYRDALEDPVLGAETAETMRQLGVDPAELAKVDDLDRRSRADLRAAKLVHAWNTNDFGGADGVTRQVVDLDYQKKRADLLSAIDGSSGDEGAAMQRQLERLDRRQDEERSAMDAWTRRYGFTSVEHMLSSGDGIPDIAERHGDLYEFVKKAWKTRELPPQDLLAMAQPAWLGSADVKLYKLALANKSPAEVDAILTSYAEAYPALCAGKSEDEIRRMLIEQAGSGTDGLEILRLTAGDPTKLFDPRSPPEDPEERRLGATQRYDLELKLVTETASRVRTGSDVEKVTDLVEGGGELLTGRQSTAANTDLANAALRSFAAENTALLKSGDPTAWAKFERLKSNTVSEADSNTKATADLATKAANLVKLAGAVLLTVATAGGASPLGLALISVGVGGVALSVEQGVSDGQMTDQMVAQRWRDVLVDAGSTLTAAKLRKVLPSLDKVYEMDEEVLKVAAKNLADPEAYLHPDVKKLVQELGKTTVQKLLQAKLEQGAYKVMKVEKKDANALQNGVAKTVSTLDPTEGLKTGVNSKVKQKVERKVAALKRLERMRQRREEQSAP